MVSRSASITQDIVERLLSNRVRGTDREAARGTHKHGAVDDPESIDAVHPELGVDARIRAVLADPAAARHVVAEGVVPHVLLDRTVRGGVDDGEGGVGRARLVDRGPDVLETLDEGGKIDVGALVEVAQVDLGHVAGVGGAQPDAARGVVVLHLDGVEEERLGGTGEDAVTREVAVEDCAGGAEEDEVAVAALGELGAVEHEDGGRTLSVAAVALEPLGQAGVALGGA